MSEPVARMTFQEAYTLINSSMTFTNNEEFERLKKLVRECEQTINLGKDVFRAFPLKDDEGYCSRENLQSKVQTRLQRTAEFMAKLGNW